MTTIRNTVRLSLTGFVLFLAITTMNAQAPKVTFKLGSEVESDLKGSDKIFNDPDGTVYLAGGGTNSKAKHASGQNMIEKISPNLAKTENAYIYLTIPDEDEDQPAFAFEMLNGKLLAFGASTDFDVKDIYAIEVDKATLKTTGKPVKIFKSQATSEYDYPAIMTSESEQQLMLFKFEALGEDRDEGTTIHVKVFEGTLESSWEKNVGAPAGITSLRLSDLKLYDDGTLMMIGYDTYDGDFAAKARKEKRPGYMDHIITLAEHSETVIDRKLEMGDLFSKTVHADMLEGGKVICTGFYSDDGKEFTDGVFYAAFDPDKTTASFVKSSPFSADFIENQMDEGFVHSNANDDRLKNAYVRQIFVRNDGSVTLVGEHVAVVPRSSSSNVYFLEALVISVNAKGEIAWAKRVFKDQEQRGVLYIDFAMTRMYSFYASVYNDQLLLFFNDDIESSETQNADEPKVFSGEDDCMLMCVSVSATGDISKQKVKEFDKTKTSPCVCMFHQTGKADFIYFGWGHNISDDVNGIHIGN